MRGLIKRREVIGAAAVAGVFGAAGTAGALAGLSTAAKSPDSPQSPQAQEDQPAAVDRLAGQPIALPQPDPEQRYVQLIPAGDGIIYGLQANGALVWLRHLGWQDGTPAWANGGKPKILDTGWLRFRWVLAGRDGQLLGVTQDGEVTWHRYHLSNADTGEGTWAANSGSVIRNRLGRYDHVFGGPDGVIYGVRPDDFKIFWHRYLAGDGTAGWSAWARFGVPSPIGVARAAQPFTDPDGDIYERYDNKLSRRRYDRSNGDAGGWAETDNVGPVITSWTDLRMAIAMGDGVFYTIDNARRSEPVRAEELVWRRLAKPPASVALVNWFRQNDRQIAAGFTIEPLAALQGYTPSPSVQQGAEVGLAVSTGHPNYTVTVMRLASGRAPAEVVIPAHEVSGRLQPLPPDYRSGGCGWTADTSVPIGPDWVSGLYVARLGADGGRRFDIPFVVRPTKPSAPIAFLWPTFTYNAYNNWGGHSQYTPGLHGRTRTLSMRRPSVFNNVDASPDSKLTGDLILLRWLAQEKIPFDCYHDGDLHSDDSWLSRYRALVLGVHPEYWTDQMYDRLAHYLASGGRLIYLGGNGIYERVRADTQGTALAFRKSNGQRDVFRALGRPESRLLGVAYHDPSYGTRAPYQVKRNHPLLAGTGLAVGSVFGETGALGAASGWEMDRRGLPGCAEAEHVIAEGQNAAGGAEMVFRPGPNGGWVFSAGSLTFVGALPQDAAMRRLVRNVFDLAAAN